MLSLTLLVGFVLSAVSLGTAWWAYSYSGGGTSDSVQFTPGSTYSVSCSGSGCGGFVSGSSSYSSWGGSIASIYGSLEVALIAAVAIAGLATVLGLLSLFGRGPRTFGFIGCLLGVVSGATLLGLSAWVVSSQPGAFGSDVTFLGTHSGGPSPASSFWGSATGGGASATWGAGAGWYGALLGGVVLLAISCVLVLVARSRAPRPSPYDERPFAASARHQTGTPPVYAPTVRTAAAPPPSAPPRSYTAPPLSAPVQASAKTPVPVLIKKSPTAEPTVDCPACGYANSSRAKTCAYCQRPMRST